MKVRWVWQSREWRMGRCLCKGKSYGVELFKVKIEAMRGLFIQPPVYDFTCHDFWLKPYGLIKLAGLFRQGGWEVYYFDFLDRFQEDVAPQWKKSDQWGRGKFPHHRAEKPPIFKDVPRYYKRFGRSLEVFQQYLAHLPSLDGVFITVPMAYWVDGVEEILPLLKGVPLYAGGIGPTLFPQWFLSRGIEPVKLKDFSPFLARWHFRFEDYDQAIPAWDFYAYLPYLVTRLSYGCPFHCTYCALPIYGEGFQKRDPHHIQGELTQALRKETKHLVFYDDALLHHLISLEGMLPSLKAHPLRLHTPNGLHTALLTEKTAKQLKSLGFTSCYLGVETLSDKLHQAWGGKTQKTKIEKAIRALRKAGFQTKQLFAYILWGHPDVNPQEVEETVQWVEQCHLQPRLADYSPLPGTPDGDKVFLKPPEDPRWTNKTYQLYRWASQETLSRIKNILHA